MTVNINIGRNEVEAQLDRILASPAIRPSKMLCDMLRYVVEETLEGRQHAIKGYILATRVFGRSEDFDLGVDPIVRIHAGRLRRRLSEYYAGEGADDPFVIGIPKGGYVPVFSRNCEEAFAHPLHPGMDTAGAIAQVSRSRGLRPRVSRSGALHNAINCVGSAAAGGDRGTGRQGQAGGCSTPRVHRDVPGGGRRPGADIRGFVHADRHVEKLLEGLEMAAELVGK